jgi:ADP-heptose:LPS heptosyltransferase
LSGPSPEALAILYLSEIPLITAPEIVGGFSPMNTLSYRILLRFVATRPHYIGRYAPLEYLRLLEIIDINTKDTKKILGFSEQAMKKVEEFFRENGIKGNDFIVGISPGTGHRIKLWGGDKFAKVAEWLNKQGAKVILIGSEFELDLIDEVIKNLEIKSSVINSGGEFNIDELKALISKIKILISVDTGPIYIAEAFDVATVDIVGPMNDEDQPPRGSYNRIVKADRIRPEISVLNSRGYNEKEARRQSDAITAEMVIGELELLLNKLKK